MKVQMVLVEEIILREIADPKMTRKDIALIYAFGIRDEPDKTDWAKVNEAIISRWSLSALDYIKNRAWRIIEKGIDSVK